MLALYALPLMRRGGLAYSLRSTQEKTETQMPVRKPQLPAEQRRKAVLTAYVTEDEYARIVESSEKACMTVSEFARRVCTGVKIESREDQKARLELLKVNADLGRLGGLLKQALAEGHSKSAVIGLLHKIDRVQAELKEKVRAL